MRDALLDALRSVYARWRLCAYYSLLPALAISVVLVLARVTAAGMWTRFDPVVIALSLPLALGLEFVFNLLAICAMTVALSVILLPDDEEAE